MRPAMQKDETRFVVDYSKPGPHRAPMIRCIKKFCSDTH